MPYRSFADSTGTEWQVWDIIPRLSERRSGDSTDRRVATVVVPFADRREDGRRLSQTRRTLLRGTYSQGWLCFDSGTEKRRLSPIPDDWTTCTAERLESYARHGAAVGGAVHHPFMFEQESPRAETG